MIPCTLMVFSWPFGEKQTHSITDPPLYLTGIDLCFLYTDEPNHLFNLKNVVADCQQGCFCVIVVELTSSIWCLFLCVPVPPQNPDMLTRKIKLCHINAHITCRLCEGYLIDATTVTECLHTCRSSPPTLSSPASVFSPSSASTCFLLSALLLPSFVLLSNAVCFYLISFCSVFFFLLLPISSFLFPESSIRYKTC